MSELKISNDLSLPLEAVTQTFAILAKRGVGKTYTASVMVEEMLKANLHVVVVDPIGVWWGLRSSSDGKKAGLPIVIAGGEHADVPIEPTSGEVLADMIVSQQLSMVIDISLFRKHEQHKFMTAFAETLYRKNRQAVHLILDEADEFAPQRALGGDEPLMLGAIEDLVRRGRARGIGVTMITQRPAVLNKNVLTQIEVLVALRLTSPQDRAAIADWVKYHAEGNEANEMLESLGSLPVGTAWFWSPGWLDIFKKVHIRVRETLDSSSTPKVGQRVIAAQKMADVDLAKIREQLSLTIEKAAADDPKVLRSTIIKLRKELADQKPQVETKEIKVPILSAEDIENLQKAVNQLTHIGTAISESLEYYLKPAREEMKHFSVGQSFVPELPKKAKLTGFPGIPDGTEVNIANNGGAPKITGGAKRMLEVLGLRHPMTFTRTQLARLSKMSPRSGTFGTYMSLLKSNGLITQEGSTISLTREGLSYIGGAPLQPQTTDEVLDMWRGNLTGRARRMFDVLVGYYPSAISREELGQEAEISPTSGTFGTYISMLAGNGLIERSNQSIAPAIIYL